MEEKALGQLTVQRLEVGQLFGGLDALCDGFRAQSVGQVHDRGHYAAVFRVLPGASTGLRANFSPLVHAPRADPLHATSLASPTGAHVDKATRDQQPDLVLARRWAWIADYERRSG